VMAELLLGSPLFPGESGVDQLVEIIKVGQGLGGWVGGRDAHGFGAWRGAQERCWMWWWAQGPGVGAQGVGG
jgi:hypothetical protein